MIVIFTITDWPVGAPPFVDKSETLNVKSVIPGPGNLAYVATGIVNCAADEMLPETPNWSPTTSDVKVTLAEIVVPSQSGFPLASLTVMSIGKVLDPLRIVSAAAGGGSPVTTIGATFQTVSTLSVTLCPPFPCVVAAGYPR